ncbi:MAG TPA: TonB family protein [Pyrinomonadaceae bacterium]|nr:TonB family protein [Pyrinomonadaceae bacterium]
MEAFRTCGDSRPKTFLLSLALLLASASASSAQTTLSEASPTPDPAAAAVASETEALQRRLTRARSLAAVGKLAAAASDLEALRASSADESVRDVARVLLMSIFVEMPDYTRAHALLEEAFKARTATQKDDAATHSYFALAGQTINGVRTHLERYRSFGINIADTDLPAEANSDLANLRSLVELVVANARAIRDEQGTGGSVTKGQDATALLEDAASVRLRMARDDADRTRWQTEVSEARQRLFASETRIASISQLPAVRPTPAPSGTNAAANTSTQSTAPTQRTTSAPRPAPTPQPQSSAPAQTNTAAAQPPAPQSNTGATPDAAKSTAEAPVAVGSLAGKARQKYSPSYPSIAKAARVSGVVTVYLLVNENGEVESVQRAEGPLQLQQAAMDAARRWKFNQTVVNGQPARVTGYLSFNFAL